MIAARAMFFLSVATTLFWVFGFAAEGICNAEPPLWSYSTAALVAASLSALALFRARPHFLCVPPGAVAGFVRGAVAWSVASYVAGALAVGGVSYWLMVRGPHVSESLRGESASAAYMLALWLPLWFSPAIGLSLAWWKMQK